jgi:hypothetical protein
MQGFQNESIELSGYEDASVQQRPQQAKQGREEAK